ncbi:MAG: GFA family protein [Polyangiaceae bacterium]
MGATKHSGGCHCGKVRFDVTVDLGQPAITCNCSICAKTGTMLTFVDAESFSLKSGEESLTDYTFNSHTIHHVFCKICGIRSFARGKFTKGEKAGKAMVAVNARCLDDVDPAALPTHAFDGKKL